MISSRSRVLVVDLNNFAMYPTLSVGYITSICRGAGLEVSVFSPLSIGVQGVVREEKATRRSLIAERLNFATAQSSWPLLRLARSWVGENVRSSLSRHHKKVARAFSARLESFAPRVVLISTYLMYRDLVEALCASCARAGIPVLAGGPYFAQPEVLREWVGIKGLTALAAGEVESQLPQIIEGLIAGNGQPVLPGLVRSDGCGGYHGSIAAPLPNVGTMPFPDYTDFPWERYPQHIVPLLTGRGCGWGRCTFCSDITSTAGRSFRSRSPENVLGEVNHHYKTLGAKLFVFTDLKLNSSLAMWHTIISDIQRAAPGARWIASVHVGRSGENGLGPEDLRAAAASGCVRLTSGLESGSQRLLDNMKKGIRIEGFSDYLRDATAAGISTRATMIAGYPGEQEEDVRSSTEFVSSHENVIERIKLCNFSLVEGTEIHRTLVVNVRNRTAAVRARPHLAQVDFHPHRKHARSYRKAMSELVTAVHRVNRKPLREPARVFEGVM